MTEFLTFLFLGLGVGAIYALCAQGLVLVYRGSRVVNFAQGAMALVGASVYAECAEYWPLLPSVLMGIGVCALLGFALHILMQRLSGASELARVVVTLGVMTVLEGAISLRYGSQLKFVESVLPSGTSDVAGATVPWDRAALVGIAVVMTVVLWLVYSRTHFGLRTAAVSENRRALAALGWNTGAVSAANWVIGSMIAGLGGILIAPIVGLEPSAMTLLIIPALAAAAVGAFNSFPMVLGGGLLIGVLQSEVTHFVPLAGLSDAVPFLAVLAVVLVRRDVLGSRITAAGTLPRLGSGRIRPVGLAVVTVVALASLWLFGTEWSSAVSLTMAAALIGLSVVVLTGYTRQISLGQYAVAGLGAWIATRLSDVYGLPFPVAFLVGLAGAIPIGMLFALPALRARGVILAVVTLGLGVAVQALVFNNPDLTGGPITGTVVEPAALFGLSLSPIEHPERYAAFTLVVFILVALIVRNVRRSRSGRRLLAVRTNERAAAALGISVTGAKMYAFALATAIAAAGGIVLAFRNTQITFEDYQPLESILLVLAVFIGGIGFIVGSVLGATFVVGSVVYVILENFFDVGAWVTLIGGILVILTVIQEPDGVVGQFARLRAILEARLRRKPRPARDPLSDCDLVSGDDVRGPALLNVEKLTVRFGGVTALRDVDISVASGEVVGLIGPNGAGKSTLVDAVVGLNRRYSGQVSLDGVPLDRLLSFKRSRLGLCRSFQTLELFEDLTVLENILAACDRRTVRSYLTDLVRPGRAKLTSAAKAAIDEFGLAEILDERAENLSYGTRRLVAIARAFAGAPRILLLDEPTAGLDEVQSRHLGDLITRMAEEWNIGVLLIEHDVALVMRVCHRISVLNFGRRIAQGTAEEIRTDPAVVDAYIGTAHHGDEAAAIEVATTSEAARS